MADYVRHLGAIIIVTHRDDRICQRPVRREFQVPRKYTLFSGEVPMAGVDIDSTSVKDYDITSKAIPLRAVNLIV